MLCVSIFYPFNPVQSIDQMHPGCSTRVYFHPVSTGLFWASDRRACCFKCKWAFSHPTSHADRRIHSHFHGNSEFEPEKKIHFRVGKIYKCMTWEVAARAGGSNESLFAGASRLPTNLLIFDQTICTFHAPVPVIITGLLAPTSATPQPLWACSACRCHHVGIERKG